MPVCVHPGVSTAIWVAVEDISCIGASTTVAATRLPVHGEKHKILSLWGKPINLRDHIIIS
jgi:hypothetical protein